MASEKKIDPIRPTDDDARALTKGLIRTARAGSLATLQPDGHPFASLTSLATDVDGTPLILVSGLSLHTQNLRQDGRASLLVASSGKGDPLAHPRATLIVQAEPVVREGAEGARIRRRFLARQPKAALYVDFPDFGFVRLAIRRVSLNGGFGKAYELTPEDVLSPVADAGGLIEAEESALTHMNEDHADTVRLLAHKLAGEAQGAWRMTGIDPEGFDLMLGERTARVPFPARVANAEALHKTLAKLARDARES